jgi:hypothetical protein
VVVGADTVVPVVVAWVVVVPVGVVVVVVVVVVLVVGGGVATTVIVAVMNWCRSQWKVYVPAAAKVQVPVQPDGVGRWGSGGTDPLPVPDVCVQLVGCEPFPKSAL